MLHRSMSAVGGEVRVAITVAFETSTSLVKGDRLFFWSQRSIADFS